MGADRPRYTTSIAVSAQRLAYYISATFEPQGHVIIQDAFKDIITNKVHRDELADVLREWLSYRHPTRPSLIQWSLLPGVDATHIAECLRQLAAASQLVSDAVVLLRNIATGFRTSFAWAQGPAAGTAGFDIFGAMNYLCQGQTSPERLAAVSALRAYLMRTGYPKTIAEWNDEPGRTRDEVILLLELCAADMEIV